MMKLAIIFLPILFAVIWAAFIGLRINKVETRDGKRKLINQLSLVLNIFENILKANLFTSLILIDTRSNLDPTF